jgi:hypothetical protein
MNGSTFENVSQGTITADSAAFCAVATYGKAP